MLPTKFGRRDGSSFTRVGRLKHRVDLLNWKEFPDNCDSTIVEYPPVCSVWSDIEPLNPERFVDGVMAFQTERTPTHRVTIRWRDDIDSCRFVRWCRKGVHYYARVESVLDLDHAQRFSRLLVRLEHKGEHANQSDHSDPELAAETYAEQLQIV